MSWPLTEYVPVWKAGMGLLASRGVDIQRRGHGPYVGGLESDRAADLAGEFLGRVGGANCRAEGGIERVAHRPVGGGRRGLLLPWCGLRRRCCCWLGRGGACRRRCGLVDLLPVGGLVHVLDDFPACGAASG